MVGRAVAASNAGSGVKSNNTNSPDIHICNYTLVSSLRISSMLWEYVFRAEVTNTGLGVLGLTATLRGMPSTITVTDKLLVVGAVASGETVKSIDTITMRSTTKLANPVSYIQQRAAWSVTIQR